MAELQLLGDTASDAPPADDMFVPQEKVQLRGFSLSGNFGSFMVLGSSFCCSSWRART